MQQSICQSSAIKCVHEEENATKKEGSESDTRALFTASLDADRPVVLAVIVSCARGKELPLTNVELISAEEKLSWSCPTATSTSHHFQIRGGPDLDPQMYELGITIRVEDET